MEQNKTICFDVDNTICISRHGCDYSACPPIIPVINKLNALYDSGWKIILFSSRNMVTYEGDLEKIEKYTRPILEKWLKEHGVKYHELIFGKPFAKWYVDDKAISPSEFLYGRIPELEVKYGS